MDYMNVKLFLKSCDSCDTIKVSYDKVYAQTQWIRSIAVQQFGAGLF